MGKPDQIDYQLAILMGQDGRQNSETLAKKLKLSAATVRRRLRKLFSTDALRIVGIVDPAKFDMSVAVIIGLDIAHDKVASVLEVLAGKSEIRIVASTSGRFDAMALARFSSIRHLSDFITLNLSQIDGVKDSETFVCLDFKRGNFAILR